MSNDFNRSDMPYRRGLVLGLSLAEIFLILLFLLLVVAINIVDEYEVKRQELMKQEDFLKAFEVSLGRPIIEEDFQELIKTYEERVQTKEFLSELMPYRELEDAFKEQQVPQAARAKLIGKVTELVKVKESEQLSDYIIDPEEERSFLELSKENQILIEKIDSIGIEKGELPSCWYLKRDNPKDPEKEIKTFDIKIFDNSIYVADRDSMEEYKNNDNANFGVVENLPNYPKEFLNKEISYPDFLKQFKPFFLAGEQKEIQSYRCRFFVGLWDNTTSKVLYKKRTEQIESLFYKYLYKKDKWPHANVIKIEKKSPKKIESPIKEVKKKKRRKFLGIF